MMDQQNQLLLAQEDKLDLMGESMGNIRNMSSQIAVELDEQGCFIAFAVNQNFFKWTSYTNYYRAYG